MTLPINPYETSQTAEPQTTANAETRRRDEVEFSARLTGADRRDLLRSVGPTRVMAVLSLVLWVKQLYSHVTIWGAAIVFEGYGLSHGYEVLSTVIGFAWLAQGVLSIYGIWLEWQYAGILAESVGGRASTLRPWTSLHYRTARLWMAIAILHLSVEFASWLHERWYP
jgi:hypothetical protein